VIAVLTIGLRGTLFRGVYFVLLIAQNKHHSINPLSLSVRYHLENYVVLEKCVKKHFGFLENEFGFSWIQNKIGYEKNGLEIEFHHGKGELDIDLFVSRDDEVFRPYISRSFDFLDIARRGKGSKLKFPESATQYIVSDDEIDLYLKFSSELMRKYCTPLIQGDLSLLEAIHESRKNT